MDVTDVARSWLGLRILVMVAGVAVLAAAGCRTSPPAEVDAAPSAPVLAAEPVGQTEPAPTEPEGPPPSAESGPGAESSESTPDSESAADPDVEPKAQTAETTGRAAPGLEPGMARCATHPYDIKPISQMVPVSHKGVTYYVCCQDCAVLFLQNPERYIAMLRAAEGASGSANP